MSANDHAHAFSCGFASDSGPLLGIEYTSYRDDALDAIMARAQRVIAAAAAAAD